MSKTVDDLVRVFEIAHYGAANGPADKTRLRAGVTAIVRALRDEIVGYQWAENKLNEILGDTAEARSAGVLAVERREGAMISEAPEAPATDAAPAVCEITAERDRLKAALECVRQYVKGGPDHVSDEDITNIFRISDSALGDAS